MDDDGNCYYCHQPFSSMDPLAFSRHSMRDLELGAQLGCSTCRIRFDAARNYNSDPEAIATFSQSKGFTFDRREFFDIFKLDGNDAVDEPDSFPLINSAHLLGDSTSSDSTFARIRGWIDNCLKNHTACATTNKPPYTPKRLIDVRNNHIVLRDNAQVTRYACLSHCWGPSQSPIRTLNSTLADFQKDIPWSRLSKTFQDVVDICRRLDIGHLWLDSLCIIQDSPDDWNEQSVLMADIYQNALITIAAAKSSDGSGGCYVQRDPGYLDVRPVVPGRVYTRKWMPHFLNRLSDAEHVPLLRRGWVLQEMLLSTRVVYYLQQEVVWQCRSCNASESGCNDKRLINWMKPLELIHGTVPRVESWHALVNRYSALMLTYDKDRLAAFASFSERFAETRTADDRFLAGLWQGTLLEDMVWQVDEENKEAHADKRPETWRTYFVPSWSWASVRRSVIWRTADVPIQPLDCITIVDIHVQSQGSPYLGKFTRSDIVLRGPLIPCRLVDLEATMHQRLTTGQAAFQFEETLRVALFSPDYAYAEVGPDHLAHDSEVFLLPLTIRTTGYHSFQSLVLRHRNDRPDMAYERIGLAEVVYSKGMAPWKTHRTESAAKVVLKASLGLTWTNSYLSTLPAVELILT